MKFHRLRISNYRGIDVLDVEFGSHGITLVQGPNETGKTSLRESIGLLFEYPDSSKRREIEAIRPVHQDKGPEIELQAESGAYAFTYFKRFYKKPETKLTITQPKPENHIGREAHDRAETILQETLDVNLWRALGIQQGVAIHQPNLTSQVTLSAALDQAAGGSSIDPREEGLFVRVREEYNRYFTDRGSEKKEIQEELKRKTDVQDEIAGIKQQLLNLDDDVERTAALQRELERLKKQEEEQEIMVGTYTASLKEIEDLERFLKVAKLELDSARQSELAAHSNKDMRQSLIDAVSKAANDYKKIQESVKISHSALNQAEGKLKEMQATLEGADRKRKDVDTIATLRRADYDYFINRLHLEQFKERKERVDQARKDATSAEEELARNKVDSSALEAIREAERGLLAASAQLEMGAPSVHLRGLAECTLEIDRNLTTLAKDEVRTLSVADKTQLTIPNILDVQISAGSSTEELSRKTAEAQRALDNACKTAGVNNLNEAKRAVEKRRQAMQHLENKGQIEEENLRDLSYEELEKRLISLERSVPDYPSRRAKKPLLCDDSESAEREWENANSAQQKANVECEAARQALDAARDLRDQMKERYQESYVQLGMLQKNLNHTRDVLNQARSEIPDNKLDANVADAARKVAAKEANLRSAEASLGEKDPERVRTLAETAKGSLQTTQNRRSTCKTELTEVQTRLKVLGEDGLQEKLDVARSDLVRLEKGNLALLKRADAAKLLYEIMREERDRARRAYAAPLREKIEALGCLLFDSTFQVEISEELKIASSTAKGVTVPFDSLSGGTREQLSLIFRLACSMIVAKNGGIPIILDDPLGYTDPERLRLMGAVLAMAAKERQIIIFTCVPDRFSSVGEATVVSLA